MSSYFHNDYKGGGGSHKEEFMKDFSFLVKSFQS